ncbi:recombinase XerD [Lonepinella koalarum]|uniref:Recombinase XerD n=1 Tax=Lonepinella koalarum TaxID=53417 RepID=A0A4R1KYZ4_9PAST|nr:DUF5339 domain-containing protein [Lonepinella koalarum]TCK69867.1 hypothetical protein EV692_1081 [Lonepinella koalarum]TFJ90524.1 recombinase XerD [Lonepinella koalarum]TYG35221.1 recombinase XerD [Lonepinella koalarum]
MITITTKLASLCLVLTVALISSFPVSAADGNKIPEQCEKLFQETEKLFNEAQRQPGTHTQLNKIQNKLNQSKKQILEMEIATQIKSCDQGLAKLSQLHKPTEENVN